MHRRVTTAALGATLAAVLAVSACSSKSTDSDSSSSGSASAGSGLTISALAQIDTAGKEQPKASDAEALDPSSPSGQKCDPATIAMAGALTGADAALEAGCDADGSVGSQAYGDIYWLYRVDGRWHAVTLPGVFDAG